jgi:hypothetical protein
MVAITFRGAGAWGAGKGSNLNQSEFDNNNYNLKQAVEAALAASTAPNEITSITVTGNLMTIHMAGGGTFGPFVLPVATFTDRGDWAPSTLYSYADIFTDSASGLYMVLQDHTSGLTFNPAASTMLGPLYRLLFSFSGRSLHFIDAGWLPLTVYAGFEVFSRPDDGVYMIRRPHTSAATFDPAAVDGLGNPLYLKLFNAIETAIARIQFQYPGSFPADSSLMWKLIQDDPRNLIIPAGWTNSIAHLNVAVTTEIIFTYKVGATTVGTLTFSPATLPDGSGGQFGTFAGIGIPAGLAYQGLLRLFAPGTADTTGRFLTVAVEGSYAP